MRKIEREMLQAVQLGMPWVKDNTQVSCSRDAGGYLIDVRLHNNLIYSGGKNGTRFTLAGWNTVTTRSRLNALGIRVSQRKGIPYYIPINKDKKPIEIDSDRWYNINELEKV